MGLGRRGEGDGIRRETRGRGRAGGNEATGSWGKNERGAEEECGWEDTVGHGRDDGESDQKRNAEGRGGQGSVKD